MNKKTILIDCDDTQTDFVEPLLELYNQKYNDNIQIESIVDWNIHNFLKKDCENIFKEFADCDFIMSCNPIENSIDVINRLHDKYNIFFVSAVHPSSVESRDKKLQSMFGWYNYSTNLMITSNKKLIKGDILIDDCFSNHGGSANYSILFDRPWNSYFVENDNMYRSGDWLEIEKLVYKLLD